MKRILTLTFILFYHLSIACAPDQRCSTVKVEGKILDAITGESIEAKITYELLPGGNITGIRNFDGSFHLSLQHNYTYQINISSTKYLPLQIKLTTSVDSLMSTNFYLQKKPAVGELYQLKSKILFEQGKCIITNSSFEIIDQLVMQMQESPKMKVQLEGHTDQGNSKVMMTLSEDRVQSVRDYMIEQGISKKRIKTRSFGGTKPLTEEDTHEAHSRNRRVEVRVLKM